MSFNILIIDKNETSRSMVEDKLSKNGFEVKISDFGDEALTLFDEFLPQITIMDFSDAKVAGDLTEKMIEFDHTTCIFGVTAKVTHEIKTIAFASGVRALIQSNNLIEDSKTAEELVKTITSACTDMRNEPCLKCWEFNSFADLELIDQSIPM